MLRTANKRLYIGKPLGQAFGPANPLPVTANLQGWYDCSDLSTLTIVSNKVSQWDDKSGNGFNLTQATAGTRPLYDGTPRTMNGVIVPEFQHAQYMDSSCPADDRTCTTFVVAILDTISTNNAAFGASANGGLEMQITSSTGEVRTVKGGIANIATAIRVVSGSTFVFCQRLTATLIEHNFWGTNAFVSDSTTFTSGRTLRLGAETSATAGWDGLIAEFVRYSVTLTDAEMAAVQSYLLRKWFMS